MLPIRFFYTTPEISKPIKNALGTKVDKEEGMGLSQNSYTDEEKDKLDGIEPGAEVNVQSDWNESSNTSDAYIWNKPMLLSQFTNDRGFINNVYYDSTNKKLVKTVNELDSDIVTIATIKLDLALTKSDVGLGNVDNVQQIPLSEKGSAGGVAELDSNGIILTSHLPSYVDDVLEYANKASFPSTGETGKIYVDKDTNLTWRWSGSGYVEISPSLALGETSSTAYRGDRGKVAYTHATDSSRLTTATAVGLYKIGSTDEGHISSLVAVTKSDITGLGIPGQDTDTWRPVQCEGTSIGNNTLNIKAGTNVSLSNTNGTITINSTDTDTNTWRPLGTGSTDACAGNDPRLSDARPASDVYSWAKASTKPTYDYSELTGTPDIASILNRLDALERIWKINGNYIEPASSVQ